MRSYAKLSVSLGVFLCLLIGLFHPVYAAKDENLYQQCNEKKPALLSELESYVNIDSGSGHGPGLKEFQNLLIERLKEIGAEVEYEEVKAPQAGYNVKAVWRGTGKGSILILAHADTVFAAGTAAKRPFGMDENRAYGPGVSDEKGGLTLALNALTLLHENKFTDFEKITFFINPDEEKSSTESKAQLRELAKEHTYTLCVEPGIPGDAIMNWRKGSARLIMEVFGKTAHAGVEPEKGRNATIELGHQLAQLYQKLDNPAKKSTVAWTTMVASKTPPNVIPDYASVLASVRVLYADEFDRILKDAEKISQNHLVPDTQVKFTLNVSRPPFSDNPGTEKLTQHMKAIYKNDLGLVLGIAGSGGSSDANHAAAVGSITVDGLGLVGGNDHTPNEYIELSSVVPRLYLLTRTIMDIGNGTIAP